MKKALIVHAHPEKLSFNSALKDKAISVLNEMGYTVNVSDLYEMGFDPVGGKQDFIELKNHDFFKFQLEQVNAYEHDLFTSSTKEEMRKFEESDLIIFNFPLWWFGLPAILKGWVDRVFAMGFAYGAGKGVYDNGFFKEKQAFLCLTTGGPDIAYGPNGKNGSLDTILYPIQHGMLYFVGMNVKPAFISFSPARKEKNELESELRRYEEHLKNLEQLPSIY